MLDVMMPGMDGPAVLEALRGDPATAAIPVVFITERTSTQDRERLLELGAIAVIAKPFDPMMLANELRTARRPTTTTTASCIASPAPPELRLCGDQRPREGRGGPGCGRPQR